MFISALNARFFTSIVTRAYDFNRNVRRFTARRVREYLTRHRRNYGGTTFRAAEISTMPRRGVRRAACFCVARHSAGNSASGKLHSCRRNVGLSLTRSKGLKLNDEVNVRFSWDFEMQCARARALGAPCSFLSISLFFFPPFLFLPTLSRGSPFSRSSSSREYFRSTNSLQLVIRLVCSLFRFYRVRAERESVPDETQR